MTRKFTASQRIARLIPQIRNLHDYAIQARSKLGDYEELQSQFGQQEIKAEHLSAKFQDYSDRLTYMETVISEKTSALEALNSELMREKLFHAEQVSRTLYLDTVTKEQASKVESLTTSLESEAAIQVDLISRLAYMETVIAEKTSSLDELNSQFEREKLFHAEQVSRTLYLDTVTKEQASKVESLTASLESEKAIQIDQNSRLAYMETAIAEKEAALLDLNSAFEREKLFHAEQVKQTLYLDSINQEQASKVQSLTESLQTEKTIQLEYKNRLSQMEMAIVEKENALETLTLELSREKRLNEERVDSLEKEHNVKIQSLTESLESEKAIQSDYKSRLSYMETRIAEKEAALEVLSSELEHKTKSHAALIESLTQDLDTAEIKNNEQLEVIQFLESSMHEKVQSLEKALAELENAKESDNDTQRQNTKLESYISELKGDINTLETALRESKDELNVVSLYANSKSEEALARILGKLTLMELDTSKAMPMLSDTLPFSNYSKEEILLDRYFDLMISTLTGTLGEDKPLSPWSDNYDEDIRKIGRDWPENAYSMIGTVRMKSLQRLVFDVISNKIPGDAIETGVWRGGACILIKSIFDTFDCKDRTVWVADSFKGLPVPNPDKYAADHGDIHHTFGSLSVSKDQVSKNFSRYGLLDDNVKFLEGWFKDTLPTAPIEKLAILRLDGDMQESTEQALHALYHKVSKGGYVIVDDYGLAPCRRAIDTFRKENGITSPLIEVDGACVYWKVQ